VQENIDKFGGDPRNVTLMGHGTGAACVQFLMTSEALPEGKNSLRLLNLTRGQCYDHYFQRLSAKKCLFFTNQCYD
jgi:carboxylesterase type B